MTPFAVGLYRLPFGPAAHPARDATAARSQKSAFLYVNPGLGTFALPLRLGMPPEITVITLRVAR
jgi:predicted MPP superfamily phosphohydrolase